MKSGVTVPKKRGRKPKNFQAFHSQQTMISNDIEKALEAEVL
jgi:hypothetical protein